MIVFDEVSLELSRPRRTIAFSRTFAGSACHVLIGTNGPALNITWFASGKGRPAAGSVRVVGPRRTTLGSDGRTWWRRLLFLPEPTRIQCIERALTAAGVCVLDEPLRGFHDDPSARDRVVAAVRAATTRGATVLVNVSEWRDALRIGDVFHTFAEDGTPEASGDVETVWRPRAGEPLAPDALTNHMHDNAVVDLNGVRIPVRPRGYEMAGDSFRPGGASLVWLWESYFHVPARDVVLDPPFEHGARSGSNPLTVPEELQQSPYERPAQGKRRPDPGPIDTTARFVVLDGSITDGYQVGPYRRLTVTTSNAQRFHLDLPEGTTEPTGTVRIGFDSAHVMT